MKSIRIIFLLFILVFINGCSNTKGENPTPSTPPKSTGSSTPTTAQSPTSIPTSIPTNAITPTSAIPSITATITPKPYLNKNASEILNSMSLEEKVGQMFFVRCNNETARKDIEQYHLGGFILFANDFEGQTKTSIKTTIADYQSASDIPMLIGVDEEGGMVNRISKYSAFRAVPFKSPQDLYRMGGLNLIASDTREKARLLKRMGINVNLAPVCDVSTNPKDFIYNRSFGKNAMETSDYVKTVVSTMNAQKIGSTLKHFPGYGNNIDTHTGVAIDSRSNDQFYSTDFLPFKAGIKAGAGSILVCHNIVKTFDPDYPASLSPVVHSILRHDLKFNGVIMTDDLSMDAIKEYTNNHDAAVLAVQAGNDLLIATDYSTQIPAVIDAVNSHKISMKSINDSVLRILQWKISLGIMNQ